MSDCERVVGVFMRSFGSGELAYVRRSGWACDNNGAHEIDKPQT